MVKCDHHDPKGESHKVELLAWQVKDLKQIRISDNLMQCLTVYGPNNDIQYVNFAAGNNLIVEKIKIDKQQPENESRGSNKFVPKYFIWRFIDFTKEEVILEIDNKNRRNVHTDLINIEEDNGEELRFLGVLLDEMDLNEADEDEEEEFDDEEPNNDSDESDEKEATPKASTGKPALLSIDTGDSN